MKKKICVNLPDRNKKTLKLVRTIGFDDAMCHHGLVEKLVFYGPMLKDGTEVGSHATKKAVQEYIAHCEHQAAVAREYLKNNRNNTTTEWK